MKLLFDENLSPALVGRLAELFPESVHVHDIGLGGGDDPSVWVFARTGGYMIVSKDSDYYDLGLLRGSPPKIIWLRIGNCTTDSVEGLLRRHLLLIQQFAADHNAILVLK